MIFRVEFPKPLAPVTPELNQEILASENEKFNYYITLVEAKVKQLEQAAKTNDINRLSAAARESVKTIQQAAIYIPQKPADADQSSEIVQRVVKIKQNIEEVQEQTGIDVGQEEAQVLATKTKDMLEKGIEENQEKMSKLVEFLIQEMEKSASVCPLDEIRDDHLEGRDGEAIDKIFQCR